jgi:hypothetical protein
MLATTLEEGTAPAKAGETPIRLVPFDEAFRNDP